MNSLKTIIKFELIRYFLSPLAFVYLVCFLLLSGSCAIYFGHFFANDSANLWALFDYQPWIYLLFIPGISMRSWAEEFKSKSIVQILTLPVSVTDLVWGKFFAAWIFAAMAILLTFPFWITVNVLGTPDNTVILIGYLGCIILAGAMLAISQTMSALTKNPVIALVLAVLANLLFFWSGFDYVLFWARELFSETIVDTIISFSFLTHFTSLSRGLVELRDLVFFASLIIFFNLITIAVVSLKTKGSSGLIASSNLKHGVVVLCLLFIGFFGLNIIANNLLRQISYDFTEEKYLSLTKNTKDILRKLKRPVIAKLYYSPILEKRNPEVRQIFDQIKLMLKQYKTYSSGKFDYRIYTPKFLDKNEDKALAEGLQPIPLIDINQNALFGISFSDSLMNKAVIPFFSRERLPFLEQDLTTNIYKLHHQKKKIGLLSSLPLTGGVAASNILIEKWEIIKQIEDFYEIVDIKTPQDFDKPFDVLMLVHPYRLSDEFIEKIKKQKKVLLLLDVATEASRLYSPVEAPFVASDLGELANYWGIRFFDMEVAADFDNSITVDETVNYKTNPSFTQDLLQFKVTKDDFNPNHRTTAKLNSILFSSASMVLPKTGSDILFSPLIKASNNSTLLEASLAQKGKSPREILEKFEASDSAIILAAEFLSNKQQQPFDVIAIADTDFIYDKFWASSITFLDTKYFIPLFDSSNFILNSLDYLTENDDLITLRGKTIKHRPLYKVDNMRKANVFRYKIKENDIFKAINGAKQNLVELIAKKEFEERELFNADELALMGNMRKEMDSLRQQLSDIRLNANNDILHLEMRVKFFNIYFIALVIIALAVLLHLRKQKIKPVSLAQLMSFDKQTLKLFFVVAAISAVALATVYFENKNTISEYEDKPVLADFISKINNISVIKLQNAQSTLTFSNKGGVWVLDEFPELPVYQARIRSFLVTLTHMTYYEKKSDKVEDLSFFGFSPLDNKKSPMISVTLSNSENEPLEKFDIGWYDIELGRGAKGAFFKFDNQFQVWMVNADFYDLNLNKNEWLYSTLWNLRFGRLISFNDISEDKAVMNLAKLLLNTHFQSIVSADDIPTKQEIGKITLKVEYNNLLNLIFYKSSDNKYVVTYDFLKTPQGKHLEFFAPYVQNKYLEISEENWNKINDLIKRK